MGYSELVPYDRSATSYFHAIADMPWAIWLDSGGRDRFDILVADPICSLVTKGAVTEIVTANSTQTSQQDPLDLLRNELSRYGVQQRSTAFSGGAVGYWSYDLSRRWINLPEQNAKLGSVPEMAIGIYDWALVIDHQEKTARLISENASPQTAAKLSNVLQRLKQSAPKQSANFHISGKIHTNLTRQEYGAAFTQIHNYLNAGDCYQVNLAQTFTAQASGDALEAYLRLREISPAPYSAFMNLPDMQILSASPEKFLQLKQRQVETKPIKGTRRRGVDEQQDEQLKHDLKNNAKDRAENLMIVDLLRNDLSKSCQSGSVVVEKMFEVESYANVHHLVSTITGKLKPEQDALSLLKGCFPGGSITGAPKKRAMEIIEQLEPQRRDIYCGAIGYIGWDGNMDTSIAIRTMTYTQGEIKFSVGGGIVTDSNVDAEYQETLDKAANMLQVLKHFGGRL